MPADPKVALKGIYGLQAEAAGGPDSARSTHGA